MRLFLLDDFLYEEGRDRQEVNLVGNPFGGLHGGDVGIDEDGFHALLPHGLQGLGTGIVEFSGLADLQGSGAQEQNFLYVGISHCCQSFEINSSKRKFVSVGPLEASGWN